MKIIVGLGNPGREYKDTRHNIGYMVLEELSRRYPLEKQDSKFDAVIGHVRIGQEKVLLVKPLTYMNLSGKSVQPLVHWYKLDLDHLMVVCDDMDLPPGTIRIRMKGGSGGQRGLNSIIDRLGTKEFARMRIGIGRPERADAVDWVLGRFIGNEKDDMAEAVKKAADALVKWVECGINEAMNAYN